MNTRKPDNFGIMPSLTLASLLLGGLGAAWHLPPVYAQVPAGQPVSRINAQWVTDKGSQVYNAVAYGLAAGNTASQNASYLGAAATAAAATCGTVLVPSSSTAYAVGSLTLPACVNLRFEGPTNLQGTITVTSKSMIQGIGGSAPMTLNQSSPGVIISVASGATDVTAQGLFAIASTPSSRYVLVNDAGSASRVTVAYNYVSGACLVNLGIITSGTVVNNVVQPPTGFAANGAAAISANTGNSVIISGNHIYGGLSISLWGGDAHPGHSDYTGVPGLTDVTVSSNTVTGGGVIWGSEMQRVTYTGNTVIGAGDTGLDCEGCTGWAATGNTVQDSRNANFSTFFYSNGVQIVGNTSICSSSSACQHGGGVWFAGEQTTFGMSDNIVVADNNFLCTTGSVCMGILAETALDGVTVSHNRFKNSVIDFDTMANPPSSAHHVKVDDNDFSFSVSTTTAPAIHFNGTTGTSADVARIEILNNTITSSVTQSSSSGGIFIWHNDRAYNEYDRIEGNTITGFSKDMTLQSGTPRVIVTTFLNNYLGGCDIAFNSPSSPSVTFTQVSGNWCFNGTSTSPWPGAAPTSPMGAY
jgi:hypothetical protein